MSRVLTIPNDVLRKVKHLKENAKTNRDFEDYGYALNNLNDAIDLLFKSFNYSTPSSIESSEYEMSIKKELADCYGMKGGIYHRLAKKSDFEENIRKAVNMYLEGLKYEDETGDSYNLTNSIVTPILLDPANLEKQQKKIQEKLAIVQEQVLGKRKDQWWAWADLGLFKLLCNDKEGALDAYKQFKRVGARAQDYKSVVSVLSSLWERLQETKSPEAEEVRQSAGDAIQFLLINIPLSS